MNIDAILINHCSPTLAGLKMGALLCLPRQESLAECKNIIDNYNHKYNSKGLHFRILYCCPQRTLLYIYRPAMVEAYVKQPRIQNFLKRFGYAKKSSLNTMLTYLSYRFRSGGCFPHESGIFLGYPLEDVYGFIINKGNHAKLCGEWKVYGDAAKASHLFQQYACCRQDYINRFVVGTTLESLIVA